MPTLSRAATALAFASILAATAVAQETDDVATVVDGVARAIETHYVFADAGRDLARALREHHARRDYADLDGQALAAALTRDLRAVRDDKHLQVVWRPTPFPPPRDHGPTAAEQQQRRDAAARRSFGFRKLERLGAGRVALLELEAFLPAEWIGPTAAAAMTFAGNHDAVIVDLRENGGGTTDAVTLLASYFFAEPVHLFSTYTRTTDSTRQFWTYGALPAPRLVRQPLYVLTSEHTFSAAEGFAHHLQSHGRAVVVGETTAGGAHPTRAFPVTAHVAVRVPFARSFHPGSGANWEGTGVQPDVRVPAGDALAAARLLALERLQADGAGEAERGAELAREIRELRTDLTARGVVVPPPR